MGAELVEKTSVLGASLGAELGLKTSASEAFRGAEPLGLSESSEPALRAGPNAPASAVPP